MKVIHQPEPKKVWSTTATCVGHRGVRLGCGATVELTEDDLFRVDRQVFTNSAATLAHAEMECPICHTWSDVENYPQAEVLPVYSNWMFIKNGPPKLIESDDPVSAFLNEVRTNNTVYELPGYYAAPPPHCWRKVPENLEPQATYHLRHMTAGNSR